MGSRVEGLDIRVGRGWAYKDRQWERKSNRREMYSYNLVVRLVAADPIVKRYGRSTHFS